MMQTHIDDSIACQVCGSHIDEADLLYCKECSTPHHKDCWYYTNKCSTYNCGSTTAVSLKSDCAVAPTPKTEYKMDPRALMPSMNSGYNPSVDSFGHSVQARQSTPFWLKLLYFMIFQACINSIFNVGQVMFLSTVVLVWICFIQKKATPRPHGYEVKSIRNLRELQDLVDQRALNDQNNPKAPKDSKAKSAGALVEDRDLPKTKADD